MEKIFFFDIDGTLAIKKHIPDNNLKALQLLKEKGYATFICTGRAPFYAQNLFKDLVSGYICCNGRYIIYNGKKLHGEAFSKSELQSYFNDFIKLGCGAMLVSDDYCIPYHLTHSQIHGIKKEYGDERVNLDDIESPIYTFDLFYSSLTKRDIMMSYFNNKLVVNDHGGIGHADCSTIGYDKGNAIAYLLHYFKLSKDDAYAFGDGYNDQAMFREVHHRIAMGNAVKELKEKATYVSDDVDKNGIMKALIHENIL